MLDGGGTVHIGRQLRLERGVRDPELGVAWLPRPWATHPIFMGNERGPERKEGRAGVLRARLKLPWHVLKFSPLIYLKAKIKKRL